MNQSHIYKTIFSFCFLLSVHLLSAQPTNYTGAPGGNWNNPANWSNGVPTANTNARIANGDSVVVTTAEFAREINVVGTGVITILNGGSLTVNNDNPVCPGGCNGDAIDMEDTGTIRNFGTLTVNDADDDCIDMRNMSRIYNDGTININDSDDEGFDMFGRSRVINNMSGVINIQGTRRDAIELEDRAKVFNYGTIDIERVGEAGIDIDDSNTDFNNYEGGTISIDRSSDEGVKVDDGWFRNYGDVTINFIRSNGDGIEMDSGGDLINMAKATITIDSFSDEGIDNDSRVVNDGIMKIFGGRDSGSDGIDIGSGDRFTNNGYLEIDEIRSGEGIDVFGRFINDSLVNITMASTSNGEAIEVNGRLDNSDCGIINILSPNELEVNTNDDLFNDGIITTFYDGVNNNDGTIENDGYILTIQGINTFTTSPNPVTGGGAVATYNIPLYRAICDGFVIPTLGQWGLIVLLILLLIGGTSILKYQRKSGRSMG